MSMSKLLLAAAALAGLTAITTGADAQGYGYRHRYHRQGYSRFTGRTPNYTTGLGLQKQTATGGPSGGSPYGGK